MTQGALDFGRDHRIAEAFRGVLRAVNDAVDAAGLGVAAGACGCRAQDLSDALTGRASRHLRVEWLLAICDVSLPDHRARIVRALVAWQGMSVASARPLTAEEKLARLEQRVAAELGEAGRRVVEENNR